MNSMSHHVMACAQVTLRRTGKRVRITVAASPTDSVIIDVTDAFIRDITTDGTPPPEAERCTHWTHALLAAAGEMPDDQAVPNGLLTIGALRRVAEHRRSCPIRGGSEQ